MNTTIGDNAALKEKTLRRIAIASAIGTTIEWYDFFLYGVLAAIVLNHVFFPSYSPTIGTLLSYTTFAIGFVARPVGGIIFGHFGDRMGRKTILLLTLGIMGVSTFLIGALPGYATLGNAAPLLLLLLRVLQGIGIGGEWGGAVVLAIEHAPVSRRSHFGAYPQIGVPAGLLTSSAVVGLLNLLPKDDFMLWGWRIAFLGSIVLVAVGVFIRLRIMESPEFLGVKERRAESRVPLFDMFRLYPRGAFLTLGARYVEGACFNMFGVFIIAYAVGTLHVSRGFALLGVSLGSALMIPFILIFGTLADRIGLRRVFATGSLIIAVVSVGSFAVMNAYGEAHPFLIWLAIFVSLSLAYPMVYGPESSLFASQFDARVRYTGVSFAYQVSGIFASGLTPIFATILLRLDQGKPWYLSAYMIAVSLISFASVMAMRIPATPVETDDTSMPLKPARIFTDG